MKVNKALRHWVRNFILDHITCQAVDFTSNVLFRTNSEPSVSFLVCQGHLFEHCYIMPNKGRMCFGLRRRGAGWSNSGLPWLILLCVVQSYI